MTLLTIVNNALLELGLSEHTSIINNADKQVKQMLSFAKASGERMMKRYDWEALTLEFTHTTIASESQGVINDSSGIITAEDWERFVPKSLYNRSKNRPLAGPYTPQEWQRDLGTVSSSIQEYFRIRGGKLLITPTQAAGDTIAGEYISKFWVLDTDGTTKKATFAADSDTSLIDEDLLTLDIKWRWKKAHQFDYGEEKLEFETEYANRVGQDKGSRIINLATPETDATRVNTPEGGFGQ